MDLKRGLIKLMVGGVYEYFNLIIPRGLKSHYKRKIRLQSEQLGIRFCHFHSEGSMSNELRQKKI